jgi:hypothetical protein
MESAVSATLESDWPFLDERWPEGIGERCDPLDASLASLDFSKWELHRGKSLS